MPSTNRASISFTREIDLRMIQHLARISGQSTSAMCGMCLSEYLQQNYLRLQAFYSEAHDRLPDRSEFNLSVD
jgi:hypothetical protein